MVPADYPQFFFLILYWVPLSKLRTPALREVSYQQIHSFFMDVHFWKHVFVHIKIELRFIESEKKSLWPSQQNFPDQVVTGLLTHFAI